MWNSHDYLFCKTQVSISMEDLVISRTNYFGYFLLIWEKTYLLVKEIMCFTVFGEISSEAATPRTPRTPNAAGN